MNHDSRIVRSEEVIGTVLDGELVMLNIEKSRYFGSGEVGARIWELCETPILVERLVEQLRAEYAVSQEDCEAAVFRFLRDMDAAGLIRIL